MKIYTTTISDTTTHLDALRIALSTPTAAVEITAATSMVAPVEMSVATTHVVKKHTDRIVVPVIKAITTVLNPSKAVTITTSSL